MAPAEMLRELRRLCERLGVDVRAEALDSAVLRRGGLCLLHGKPVVVVDDALPVLDKVGVLADALRHFDLETIYVPPIVRARIEHSR
jgi:hypothetical protein